LTLTIAPSGTASSPLNLMYTGAVDRAAVEEVLEAAGVHAAKDDEAARFPTAVVDAMRSTRLLGLLVPERFGGLGGTVADVLAVSHAISRECMSSGMIFAMHQQQVAALVEHGSPTLAERVLPRVARGEKYLASVTTEAGTGGHLLSADAAVADEGDLMTIERMAPVVTGGEHADGYLITMRADSDESADRVSLIYADVDDITADTLGGWDSLGMRATRSVPMRLKGSVPPENLVGEPGGFRDVVVRTFGPLAHLGWSACWLGTASGALARMVGLLRGPERKRRDISSDLLRSRLSRIRQRLEVVHAMLAHAMRVYQDTEPARLDAPPVQLLLNALKVTASQECLTAVDELIEVAGMRHGYLKNSEVGLERAFRDLRSASLNYSNDRLHAVDGAMVLMDSEVRFA
jgi:acyl-CoA dehydrogenase